MCTTNMHRQTEEEGEQKGEAEGEGEDELRDLPPYLIVGPVMVAGDPGHTLLVCGFQHLPGERVSMQGKLFVHNGPFPSPCHLTVH